MTKINLKGLSVNSMQIGSGMFWGDKNTHQNHRHSAVTNDSFGRLNGNMNVLFNNKSIMDSNKT